MAASLPETLPDAPADSTQLTLTDDDLDKLLSGEITLEELTDEAAASNSGEQEASASAPQEGADSASAPEGSSASSGSADSRTESGSTVFLRQAGEHCRHIRLQHCFGRRKTGVLFQ